MSYKNFLGRFGHRWFTDYDRKMVLIDFSADEYDVEVTFTDDKPDTPLKDCTGTETNVDAIMIYYKDGTGRRDPEPFRWQVTGVFHWSDFSTTDDERIERLVSDFVKKEDLYLGGGSYAMDMLFHSQEEIERNKNAVTAYRTVIKTLDERQSACSGAENNCFTEIELHTYRNDNPDSPVLIAEKIVEEIKG